MDPTAMPPPDPGLPDEPEPLPPARGHGIVAERLISINGLISLLLLGWGVLALRRPDLARRVWLGLWRRLPWLVGKEPPRRPGRFPKSARRGEERAPWRR